MQQPRFELIDRYISGELNPEEKAQFEKRLETDPELRKDLEELSLMKEGVEREILRGLMERYHSELKSDKPPTARKIILKRFAFAASILVLIGLGSVWIVRSSYSDGERIFNRHFVADPGLPTTMSASGKSYIFSDGMVDYKLGDYNKAIEKWMTLLPDNPTGDTLNYFIGSAYLADGNAEKAIEFMKTAEANSQGSFQNEIHYYLGMAYLKADSLSKAIDQFQNAGTEKSADILKEIEDKRTPE